jgi:hypothetical protein
MTLYEIVLRRPDRDEIRFTDHPPKVGSTLLIDNQPFRVNHADSSQHPIAQSRYVCLPDDRDLRAAAEDSVSS